MFLEFKLIVGLFDIKKKKDIPFLCKLIFKNQFHS